MPIYEFKCNCGRKQEVILSFSEHEKGRFGVCNKCHKPLVATNQQINFAGGINMNSSSVGVAQRKYSNKAGGPKPIIDGKIRNDLKMPTQI